MLLCCKHVSSVHKYKSCYQRYCYAEIVVVVVVITLYLPAVFVLMSKAMHFLNIKILKCSYSESYFLTVVILITKSRELKYIVFTEEWFLLQKKLIRTKVRTKATQFDCKKEKFFVSFFLYWHILHLILKFTNNPKLAFIN